MSEKNPCYFDFFSSKLARKKEKKHSQPKRSIQMRKLVVSEFMSLDGVIENPAWTFPYWNDEISNFKFSELFGSDSLLLGRVTYEGFAEAWPGRTDEKGYAERMNGMPKSVVTTTLNDLAWSNSTPI